jgi:hypothetical protein
MGGHEKKFELSYATRVTINGNLSAISFSDRGNTWNN